MECIHVIFTSKGREYIGELNNVQGAGGSSVYHLLIDKYYRGRLRISADNRWIFDGEFADLAEGFGTLLQLLFWIRQEIDSNPADLFYFLYEERVL